MKNSKLFLTKLAGLIAGPIKSIITVKYCHKVPNKARKFIVFLCTTILAIDGSTEFCARRGVDGAVLCTNFFLHHATSWRNFTELL